MAIEKVKFPPYVVIDGQRLTELLENLDGFISSGQRDNRDAVMRRALYQAILDAVVPKWAESGEDTPLHRLDMTRAEWMEMLRFVGKEDAFDRFLEWLCADGAWERVTIVGKTKHKMMAGKEYYNVGTRILRINNGNQQGMLPTVKRYAKETGRPDLVASFERKRKSLRETAGGEVKARLDLSDELYSMYTAAACGLKKPA